MLSIQIALLGESTLPFMVRVGPEILNQIPTLNKFFSKYTHIEETYKPKPGFCFLETEVEVAQVLAGLVES